MNKADALTMSEFRKMREAFKNSDNKRNRALFELIFTLTLRISDVLALKKKDVIDKNGQIKDVITVVERKNTNYKGVKVKEKPKKALRDWLNEADIDDNDYIFFSPYKEGHLTRQQANNILRKKAREVGLSDKTVSTHSGRKTMGRRLRKNGAHMQKIREILGHSDESTTIEYLGIFNEDLTEEVEKLPD